MTTKRRRVGERQAGGGRTTTKVARKHDKTNPTQIDFLLESPSPCARTLATLLTAASSFALAYPRLLLLLLLLANDFTVQWSSCSSCCLLLHASLVIDGAKRSSASRSTLSRLCLCLSPFSSPSWQIVTVIGIHSACQGGMTSCSALINGARLRKLRRACSSSSSDSCFPFPLPLSTPSCVP